MKEILKLYSLVFKYIFFIFFFIYFFFYVFIIYFDIFNFNIQKPLSLNIQFQLILFLLNRNFNDYLNFFEYSFLYFLLPMDFIKYYINIPIFLFFSLFQAYLYDIFTNFDFYIYLTYLELNTFFVFFIKLKIFFFFLPYYIIFINEYFFIDYSIIIELFKLKNIFKYFFFIEIFSKNAYFFQNFYLVDISIFFFKLILFNLYNFIYFFSLNLFFYLIQLDLFDSIFFFKLFFYFMKIHINFILFLFKFFYFLLEFNIFKFNFSFYLSYNILIYYIFISNFLLKIFLFFFNSYFLIIFKLFYFYYNFFIYNYYNLFHIILYLYFFKFKLFYIFFNFYLFFKTIFFFNIYFILKNLEIFFYVFNFYLSYLNFKLFYIFFNFYLFFKYFFFFILVKYIIIILYNLSLFLSLIIPLLISVAFVTLIERKIIGYMQRRTGPVVVGFIGLLQPFADGLKLFLKETIVPSHSDKIIYLLAPLITFSLSILNWLVIPLISNFVIFNFNLSVLYILAISSLSVYGIILSGWSSNSKYAFLGAMRSSAQMISYEISISIILISIIITNNTLNFIDLINFQQKCWNILPHFPIFILFLISILAETNRHPFDLPEAEAELVSGYNVEYSSMTFALFFLGEYLNIILMSYLTVIFFLGGSYMPFIEKEFLFLIPFKTLLIIFFFIWCRAAFPRYRYDQLMYLGWKIFLPFSISWLILTLGFLFFFDSINII